MTDGLVPPLNAPPAGQTPGVGVQAGVSNQVIIAQYVIIAGAGGGWFIYSGTPAKGNPPIAWGTSGTTDPFGNPLPSDSTLGIASTATFAAGDTIISPDGIVAYNGTPAANGMLLSQASVPFTDPFGNQVPDGFTTYLSGSPGGAQSIALDGQIWQIYNTGGNASQQGSWTYTSTYWQDATQAMFSTPLYGQQPGEPTGTAASWVTAALPAGATGTLRYKTMPDNTVLVDCSLSFSSGQSGTITLFTLPAGWVPAVQADFPCRVFTATAPATAEWGGRVTTGGVVEAVALPAGTTGVFFCQPVPLD